VREARRDSEQHGGRVIKNIGDEVMAIFRRPPRRRAPRSTSSWACTTWRRSCAVPGVRIGFHFGPVVERDADSSATA
jgi:class 3 adenylate cyclase